MFFHVTEDRAEADRVCRDVLAPMLRHLGEQLRQRLLVGPADECVAKLEAYRSAGVQRIMLWPVQDELRQLEKFQEQAEMLTSEGEA
jgi:alkanesulfonate monooxygenase SsuD/methylene tetrahydromethanopterin reductase-like flavin-dependent oxidoreductase (luciferase family)